MKNIEKRNNWVKYMNVYKVCKIEKKEKTMKKWKMKYAKEKWSDALALFLL